MWPCFCQVAGLHVHVHIVFRFFRVPVDALDDDLLRALVSKEEPLVKLACNVIHALVVSQYPLGNRLTDLAHKALHIEILQHTTDDGVRQKIRGC